MPTDDDASLSPMSDEVEAEIAALARRAGNSQGALMKMVALAGTRTENAYALLPDPVREAIDKAIKQALELACAGASAGGRSWLVPDLGSSGQAIAATFAGAVGGFGGIGSTIFELPVTVTIIFGAIQKAARAHGFDPDSDEIKRHCLLVFGSGNFCDPTDDGADIGFLASRLFVNGVTVHGLISSAAPKVAAVLAQKLAAQTLPVLGSVTGATINYSFTTYYQELADIRFALLKLARQHGADRVRLCFNAAAADQKRLQSPG